MSKIVLKHLTIIYALLTLTAAKAQIHIKGNVEIDMKLGLINCDFNLVNIPNLEDYRILLNKGMNIKYFKDSSNQLINYEGHYNGKMQGEGLEYKLKTDSKFLPENFKIAYKGAFPVYKNDFSSFDYKGIIAFNGETVRATEQTKWYPVIYDVLNDKLINSYTYDLNISIKQGSTIFINGSAPKKGESAHFMSKKACPLLLFAGNYDFIEYNGNYILNTSVSKEDSEKVFENIELLKSNYSKNLGIEFTDNIYLINHRAVNKRRKGSSWGFNTYPAFAFTNLNFDNILLDNGKFNNNMFKYFGHEFGHNYFGNNVMSGKLSWFWLESFAEYLSYTTAKDLCGKDFLKETLINQANSIKEDSNFIPLPNIENRNEIGERYRYILAPLMLKCFEDKFGRKKMSLTIRHLLEYAKTETLTLEIWKKSAIKSGIKKERFEEFERKYINNKDFKENIINEIMKNYS
jgi:hypothetical protein